MIRAPVFEATREAEIVIGSDFFPCCAAQPENEGHVWNGMLLFIGAPFFANRSGTMLAEFRGESILMKLLETIGLRCAYEHKDVDHAVAR